MLARSEFVGNNSHGSSWCHFGSFFPMGLEIPNAYVFAVFLGWAKGPYSSGLGPGCYPLMHKGSVDDRGLHGCSRTKSCSKAMVALASTDGIRNIATIAPNRLKSSHWTTRENNKSNAILSIFWSMEKMPEMAPNGAGRRFSSLIWTLPTFWA